MEKLKQIQSRYNASLEVSEEDFDWLVEKVKLVEKLDKMNTELMLEGYYVDGLINENKELTKKVEEQKKEIEHLKESFDILEEQQREFYEKNKALQKEIERYKKSIEGFEKEFEYECGWQIQNAQGKSNWHKGALEGFNHVKRIFNKHFK